MSQQVNKSLEQAVAMLKASGAAEVYIFGSAANDEMRDDSDIDFAVSGLPPEQFFHALSAASRVLDRPLDLIDLDDPTPFTRYLREEGELQRVG